MTNKEFERGREYETLNHTKNFHLFLGYGCILFGVFMIVSPYWNFWNSIFLCIFGGTALYLGYSEKKELKLLEKKQ